MDKNRTLIFTDKDHEYIASLIYERILEEGENGEEFNVQVTFFADCFEDTIIEASGDWSYKVRPATRWEPEERYHERVYVSKATASTVFLNEGKEPDEEFTTVLDIKKINDAMLSYIANY